MYIECQAGKYTENKKLPKGWKYFLLPILPLQRLSFLHSSGPITGGGGEVKEEPAIRNTMQTAIRNTMQTERKRFREGINCKTNTVGILQKHY